MNLLPESVQLEALKESCLGLIGKSDRENPVQDYLPLWMHMSDTAGTMVYLTDHRLSQHLIRFFCRQLKEEGFDEPERTLKQLAMLVGFLHDIGKATVAFQTRIRKNFPADYPASLSLPAFREQSGEIYSHADGSRLLLRLLGYNSGFASVAGAHHGKTWPAISDRAVRKVFSRKLSTVPFSGGRKDIEKWKTIWTELSNACLQICGFSSPEDIPQLSEACWMILSGLLVEADWLASNPLNFPLISLFSTSNPEDYPHRWREAWKTIDFPDIWNAPDRAVTAQIFEEMFGFRPYPFQEEVLNIASSVQHPGMMIIEAPMGMGKTEASLAAADIFSGTSGSGGIYYGLPTQATANGLFGRFSRWSALESKDRRTIFKLAHGAALMNEDYQKMLRDSSHLDDESGSSNLMIHDFMQKPKTGILSDFVIGTVDQGLMMALNHKHFMLKHLGMANKTVVLDEVHAYDAYMSRFFLVMLQWLGEYHVPVLLLSATLPKERKKEMVSSYLKGWNSNYSGDESLDLEKQLDIEGYPLITWTDGLDVFAQASEQTISTKTVCLETVQYSDEDDELDQIVSLTGRQQTIPCCQGIIVNTVAKAQKLAEKLKREDPNSNILLFHSRFTEQNRAEIEKTVLKLAGKEGTAEDRRGLIVVGTQVIEQSLDLDFDVLFTELAPVDLILQRIGRLQRHERRNRPKNCSTPVCYVFEPDPTGADYFHSPVYQGWYLMRTQTVLPDSIEIPGDIPALVEKVYSSSVQPNTPEERLLYDKKEKDQNAETSKADTGALKPSQFSGNPTLDGLMDSNYQTDETRAVDSVRDIEGTLNLILLQKSQDGSVILPFDPENKDLDLLHPADFETARSVLQQKISLPVYRKLEKMKNWLSQNQELFGIWKKNPLFRGYDFVLMDADGRLTLDTDLYRYSSTYGLQREFEAETIEDAE